MHMNYGLFNTMLGLNDDIVDVFIVVVVVVIVDNLLVLLALRLLVADSPVTATDDDIDASSDADGTNERCSKK